MTVCNPLLQERARVAEMPTETFRLCIVGGTPEHRGGVEIFCERALAAILRHRPAWRVVGLPADTAYLRPRQLPRLLRALAAFRRVRRGGIDLLWLQYSNLPDLFYLLLARALRVPVVVTPHLGANSRLQRSRVLRRISAALLARADALALLFDGQAAEIVLPDGVPQQAIRTFLPVASLTAPAAGPDAGGRLRLIHAARLSEGKGTFRFVELCAALHDRRVPFEARIVGSADAATMARLAYQVADAGLVDALILAGWMEEGDLLPALRAADVLVHLSSLDSYPLIVLEAMASGTIPVVLDMAGMRAMVTAQDGHVVRMPDAAAAAADWIAAQPLDALRARGLALGVQVRRDFAWPVCVDGLAAVFAATMARRSG